MGQALKRPQVYSVRASGTIQVAKRHDPVKLFLAQLSPIKVLEHGQGWVPEKLRCLHAMSAPKTM